MTPPNVTAEVPPDSLPPIGAMDSLALQVTVLRLAVRALLAHHPEPDSVRTTLDQLLAQLQAVPALLENPPLAAHLRRFARDSLAPTPSPDTAPPKKPTV